MEPNPPSGLCRDEAETKDGGTWTTIRPVVRKGKCRYGARRCDMERARRKPKGVHGDGWSLERRVEIRMVSWEDGHTGGDSVLRPTYAVQGRYQFVEQHRVDDDGR